MMMTLEQNRFFAEKIAIKQIFGFELSIYELDSVLNDPKLNRNYLVGQTLFKLFRVSLQIHKIFQIDIECKLIKDPLSLTNIHKLQGIINSKYEDLIDDSDSLFVLLGYYYFVNGYSKTSDLLCELFGIEFGKIINKNFQNYRIKISRNVLELIKCSESKTISFDYILSKDQKNEVNELIKHKRIYGKNYIVRLKRCLADIFAYCDFERALSFYHRL